METSDKTRLQQGFTMIELVVSILIIVSISAAFLTNYHSTSKRSQIQEASQKLASDLRLAQNDSLGLLQLNGTMPAGGWGIHLETGTNDHYTIFADLNGDNAFQTGEASGQVNLPSGVTIKNLNCFGADVPICNITFIPPDPQTDINNSTSTSATITLTDESGSTKDVTVNFLGLIDVN